MSRLHQVAFRLLAWLGAPLGGIRPRRIYHWLAERAYAEPPSDAGEFRWHRDRWGHRFLLHPYYHLDRQIIAFGSYEPDALRLMHSRLEPGMVCLDVGANLGEITVNMAACVQPGGQVHAFEPVPEVAGRLRQHVAANGLDDVVQIHPVALSNE